jgi:hypothetical protein
VAIWKLACQVLQVVVHPRRLAHLGDDPEGKRVAPDGSEVLAEQGGGSLAIAGGRGADDLDVVAFPVHLSEAGTLARGSGHGVKVGEGELERRVDFDGVAQRCGGLAAVDGLLCLPVPRRGLQACGDRAAVVLKGGPGGVQVILPTDGLTLCWLHDPSLLGWPEAALRWH